LSIAWALRWSFSGWKTSPIGHLGRRRGTAVRIPDARAPKVFGIETRTTAAPGRHAGMIDDATANLARYLPGQRAGHYESFFHRATPPPRPLAFWIRYTLSAPEGRPHDAKGELWAIYFDGEAAQDGGRAVHVAVKREVPIAEARFDRASF